jgi:carbonic anhydrase
VFGFVWKYRQRDVMKSGLEKATIAPGSKAPLNRKGLRMKKLVEGIHEFQRGQFTEDRELFQSLAEGQKPRALVITCSDSRIDVARLTQTKPGEVFVLRTAGNIVPPYGSVEGGEAATIEYAVAALGIQHIVICGHSHCGAMDGLMNPEKIGSLPAVQAYLRHAEATRRILTENYNEIEDPAKRLSLAVEENVLVQMENLRTHLCIQFRIFLLPATGRRQTRRPGCVSPASSN